MLYFVFSGYTPNNAPVNRFLSLISGFSKLGIEAEVVFMLSSKNDDRLDIQWPHMHITYMWDYLNVKNRYLRQLSYTFLAKRFVRGLKSGDTVVVFDAQRLIFELINKRGIKVFTERTEHPFAYSLRTINMKKYVKVCRHLDGLFVISIALKDYFISNGVPEDKIHIINMTVDPKRFDGLEKQKVSYPYIAYCGTASNNKDGVNELIKSFAFVSKHYPNYRLYIIGKTPNKGEDESNLRLVETLGIKEKVIFTGIVSSEDMPQLLKNAEMLTLDRPDNLQAKYGFPTKLGEYLLTENPVVVTRVGDIPIFLKDKESALIAEPGNPADFANKIMWVIEHPDQAKTIGKQGAEIARKEFNAYIEASKMASFF